MATILIDSREPQSYHALGTVQTLPVGDAWIASADAVLIVERKTLADFCASIADRRIFNQVAEMRAASPWCYVVVIGLPVVAGDRVVIGGKVTGWQWNSVQGALLTVQELGANVVFAASETEYGNTLHWLARRDRGVVQITARREAIVQSPAEQVLCALPGIAQTRAEALLTHCGNVAFALDFLTSDTTQTVPGVGPSTKNAVRSVLGLPPGMRLAVIPQEVEENE